jgi:hypothetical protein
MLKKDLTEHETHCVLIESKCADCQITYKRCDVTTLHTEMICLKEQLRLSAEKRKELHEQLERTSQEYERDLKKLRQDCVERIQQFTGIGTLSSNSIYLFSS